MSEPPTCAACLTPPGTGAIAVLALRGPMALRVVQDLFRPADFSTEPGRFCLGKFGADVADQVVLAVKRTEPEPWLELHCHGGAEVVRLLLETVQRRGVRICSWQELERLAAEDAGAAAIALAEARTVRTAAILLDQYHGAFARTVSEVIAALDVNDAETANRSLAELVRWVPLGRHLIQPWRVVIAGAPNVGKSSLMNSLAGYSRSVVSAVAGTTRDVVTTVIALDGWPVELADTAGMREDAEALEEQGIQRARRAAAAADLCLWVLDGSAAPGWSPIQADNLCVAINKTDLPAAWDWSRVAGAVHVSARTGNGVAELADRLARRLVPSVPPSGAAVPFTPELCAGIAAAARDMANGHLAGARHALLALPCWAQARRAHNRSGP